jgi:hydroxyacylglutathione hydrolase
MGNPLGVRQFKYANDNFGYLIFGKEEALAVDGGAVSNILDFANAQGLKIRYVANTHMHPDHTMGTQSLVREANAQYLDNATLIDQEQIALEGTAIHVHHTPGHTRDSLVFHWDGFLITGDTLFNGTVGNCFSGDLKAFYQSISFLSSFPDDTIIYAGHDYVSESMQYARLIEPGNNDIGRYLEKYNPEHVFSTLADEKKVNPFLRFNTESLIAVLKKHGEPTDTAYHRWESLMGI